MGSLRADLHLHTYYSDGLFSPAELVNEGKEAGLEAFAVTDHDCMLACAETKKLCEKEGIKFIPGIEISAYDGDIKIHTLGYGLDEDSPAFKEFFKFLYESSIKRAEDIIFKLNNSGIKLTLEDALKERFSENSPLHIMHIATAGAKKYGKDRLQFFNEYLSYGKVGYSQICRPTPEQAVELIKESGGVSSLAHPGRISLSKEGVLSLVKRLKSCGLGGIEAVYSAHTITDTAYYKEMAKTFNLIVTGGSDAHFRGGRKVGFPAFFLDGSLAEKF